MKQQNRIDVDAAYEYFKQQQRKKFIVMDPGPRDLTAEKIEERMSTIHLGDQILFDSMKECYDILQLDRHSSTIKAVGEVVEHCGGYVMVKLKRGVLESVNYFSIQAVNGKRWNWYVDPKTDYAKKGRNLIPDLWRDYEDYDSTRTESP